MTDLYRPAFIHDYGIEITQGQDFVIGFRALPRQSNGLLYLEDTTGYTALLKVRAPDHAGAEQVAASTGDGRITLGFTPGPVARNTAYGLGQQVVPLTLNGFVYVCTVSGTSHASTEPTWPTVVGNTVTDGTVTWRCETDDSRVCNVSILIPAAVTAGLTAWGRGVYSLEIVDTFSHSWLYIDGAAYLRQEASY